MKVGDDLKSRKVSYAGVYMIYGVGIGTGVGVIIHQIALMAGIGAALGINVGSIIDAYKNQGKR